MSALNGYWGLRHILIPVTPSHCNFETSEMLREELDGQVALLEVYSLHCRYQFDAKVWWISPDLDSPYGLAQCALS